MNTPRTVLRRAPCEAATGILIGVGMAMLMQPWSLDVYSYGFTVLLAGVVGFSIAGKLPEGMEECPEEAAVASGRPSAGKS